MQREDELEVEGLEEPEELALEELRILEVVVLRSLEEEAHTQEVVAHILGVEERILEEALHNQVVEHALGLVGIHMDSQEPQLALEEQHC